MTENEAINALNFLVGYEDAVDKGEIDAPNNINSQEKEALKFILDEIQKYRELGTVEEILKVLNNQKTVVVTQHETLKQYRAIGTIEEFKALKEKSVAKKPIMIGYRKDGEPVYECGCCGSTLTVDDQPFCMFCSCKIDWSTDKEETTQTIGYADKSRLMPAT